MGVDVHGLNFLRFAKSKKQFGSVMTIGRQGLHVIEPVIREIFNVDSTYIHQPYCEEILNNYFRATSVKSVDNSNYEDATFVHDMNKPLPPDLIGKFDTVFDGGCLEHIYNIPQALSNCSLFCKPGGQILHVLPTNNYCGHGFWQFSPELFFSLYSKENGYEETQVFMADLSDKKHWYEVKQPVNGQRVNVMSSKSLYVLVRTVRSDKDFCHNNVQQSDYVFEWAALKHKKYSITENYSSVKKYIKKTSALYNFFSPAYYFYKNLILNNKLNKNNPGLRLAKIESLLDE